MAFFYSCFIGEPGVFFGAFLGPIFAILLFNSTIFVIVTIVLIKHNQKRYNNSDKAKPQTIVRLIISIMVVMVLFGLMWIFGAFTIREASTAFQFVFAILNSLQGFFIFLFFCAFRKESRELWLQVLCCRRKITVSTHSKTKRPKHNAPGRLTETEPNTTGTGLRSAPPTSPHNTDFQFSRIGSNMFSESESFQFMSNPMALQLETLDINTEQSNEVAERESSFLQSFAELGTTAF